MIGVECICYSRYFKIQQIVSRCRCLDMYVKPYKNKTATCCALLYPVLQILINVSSQKRQSSLLERCTLHSLLYNYIGIVHIGRTAYKYSLHSFTLSK